jgi:hypothetical protein
LALRHYDQLVTSGTRDQVGKGEAGPTDGESHRVIKPFEPSRATG